MERNGQAAGVPCQALGPILQTAGCSPLPKPVLLFIRPAIHRLANGAAPVAWLDAAPALVILDPVGTQGWQSKLMLRSSTRLLGMLQQRKHAGHLYFSYEPALK
jgi:hypothetical protein